jgi:archaellum component FlaC
MKKLMFIPLVLFLLVSCHNYKQEAANLKMERDSLDNAAALKDSSIVGYLNDFNEILVTLDSIKAVEKLVTVRSANGKEMNYRQKKMLVEDITLLNQLIQQNKDQVAKLQKRLNGANYKMGGLNSVIGELEQMVGNMEKQLGQKNTEIADLSVKVQTLTKDINILNQKITVIESESEVKSQTIENQILEMNKVYYAYGTIKELVDSSVVVRSGGVFGIGRLNTIKEDFNRAYFTEVDVREFDFIPLLVKKAEVVSVHPAGSFHISGEKSADTLFIDNKIDFWKASKFLVIVTK